MRDSDAGVVFYFVAECDTVRLMVIRKQAPRRTVRNPAIAPSRGYSEGTSLRQVPALHKRLIATRVLAPGSINADIGGGRYDDATEALADVGVRSFVYDPGNRSAAHNRAVLSRIEDGGADTVTIANVLNVIPDADVRQQVLELAANAVRRTGVVYIAIYGGDAKGVGRETSKGWQENRRLASYLPEVRRVFPSAKIASIAKLRVIVARGVE